MAPFNPLLPTGLDIVWILITVAIAALAAVALFFLFRRSNQLSAVQFLVWLAAILIVPPIASVAFLVTDRKRVKAAQAAARESVPAL